MIAPGFWQRVTVLSVALWPLSIVYRMAAAARRRLNTRRARREKPLGVPLVVVGSLSIGGSGKTPLTVRLAELLREAGMRPAVLCSGYGGRASAWPHMVHGGSDPGELGDESVLLARRAACPVAAGPARLAAARHLLAAVDARPDVLLSDDGLQHYRLPRDLEIAVSAGFGNGFCLPAGPLREMPSRLCTVDMSPALGREFRIVPQCFVSLTDREKTRPPDAFAGAMVNAVAGTAAPQRFFRQLESLGAIVNARAYSDHHRYHKKDLPRGAPLLMTEKDAVKCETLAGTGDDWWFLKVSAVTTAAFEKEFLHRVRQLVQHNGQTA
ncbi:MAG: tetraacyldisaccharide 4'-kinase [Gammaproteobacteria bacterium]|nr:tetraacyldisaccharide 4'-kinase [Gammaproteobacteria bacterium]